MAAINASAIMGKSGGAAASAAKSAKFAILKFPQSIQKQSDKMGFNLRNFRIANENVSLYSSLMPWHIRDVNTAFRAEYPGSPPATILETCGHIGMDTANFLKIFPNVRITVVELNPDYYELLKFNNKEIIRQLKREPDQITAINGSALDYINKPGDLVYFDPPWNGSRDTPTLGGQSLAKLATDAFDMGARKVIIKLPREANKEILDQEMGRASTKYPIHDDRKEKISYWLVVYNL